MLNGGKFTTYLWSHLCAEAVNTAMLLKNNFITQNRTLSPFEQFFGKGKKHVLTSMQKFGEMCITTYKDNTHWAKLANCGTPGVWVGCAKNHPYGTNQIYNPKTKKNILIQNVTFLQKSRVSIPRLTNLWLWQWVMRGWMMMKRNLKQFL